MATLGHRPHGAIAARERSLAKAIAAVLGLGAGFIALSLALPHPPGGTTGRCARSRVAMAIGAPLCWVYGGRIPVRGLAPDPGAFAAVAAPAADHGQRGRAGRLRVDLRLVDADRRLLFPRRIADRHLAWALARLRRHPGDGREHRRLLAR